MTSRQLGKQSAANVEVRRVACYTKLGRCGTTQGDKRRLALYQTTKVCADFMKGEQRARTSLVKSQEHSKINTEELRRQHVLYPKPMLHQERHSSSTSGKMKYGPTSHIILSQKYGLTPRGRISKGKECGFGLKESWRDVRTLFHQSLSLYHSSTLEDKWTVEI